MRKQTAIVVIGALRVNAEHQGKEHLVPFLKSLVWPSRESNSQSRHSTTEPICRCIKCQALLSLKMYVHSDEIPDCMGLNVKNCILGYVHPVKTHDQPAYPCSLIRVWFNLNFGPWLSNDCPAKTDQTAWMHRLIQVFTRCTFDGTFPHVAVYVFILK